MLAVAALFALALGAPGPSTARCATLCVETGKALRTCGLEKPSSCDAFVAAAERLAARIECAASVGYETCEDALAASGTGIGPDGFVERYFDTLSRLAFAAPKVTPTDRPRVRRALAVLGSQASVRTLDGGVGEEWGPTVRRARALTRAGVLDDEALWRKQLAEAPPRAARASSTLAPQGRHRYDAALAVDGRDETAWCAASASRDPWIEVTAAPVAGARLYRVGLVPGYARELASFQRNNRLIRMRVSPCARPEDGWVVDLFEYEGPHVDGESRDVQLRPYWFPAPAGFTGCVRLTILEVVRGRDDDTCVSEITILPE